MREDTFNRRVFTEKAYPFGKGIKKNQIGMQDDGT